MTSIIDHMGISVADFRRSRDFYAAVLGPLGIKKLMEFEHEGHHHAGFGADGPQFWIGDGRTTRGQGHFAFLAKSRADVDAFYAAAMAAGGTDNGKPGLRPHYHQHYYGAFVIDPDGFNIEAVCHAPEPGSAA